MNAKTELLEELVNKQIKCASITHECYRIDKKEFNLKVGFNEAEFNEFLNKLDFEYDDGYGTQELHGLVWLQDGTWLSRHEYDGSEYWVHNQLPEIPSELL
jgi:hypothetical protein